MARRGTMLMLVAVLLAGCNFPGLRHSKAALAPEVAPDEVVVPSRPRVPSNPWCTNNTADLYIGPKENTAIVRDLIARARQTLFIETYELADDTLGNDVAGFIKAAVQRGVKVYVLCDHHGSAAKGGERLGKRLISAGVHFRVWPTRLLIVRGGRYNVNIDHRKLYLADGDRGITGGYNLIAPFSETTHDLLVGFRGEVAAQLHREFARDWKMSGGDPLSWHPIPPGVSYGSVPARVIVTSPLEGRFEARDALYHAIDGARKNIEVEQQFLWEPTLVKKLLQASHRGVAVRVIVPGQSNGPLFRILHEATLNLLVRAGARAHRYRGRTTSAYLHTKYFSVDDRWASVGSVNGNTRAMKNNQELNVETTDPKLVAELKARLFEPDWTEFSVLYRPKDAFWLRQPFLLIWTSLSHFL